MTSTLRRTKAKALTLTRSVANTLKLSIGMSTNQHGKPPESPRPNDVQVSRISHPKRLKRVPAPQSVNSHMITQLPSELLAHIFKLGSELDSMLPITVSHVCRTWRRISLRTPTLWRQIILDSRLDMWKERIRRAKACSLDIQLVPRITHSSRRKRTHRQDMAAVQWYMHIVTPHIRRWRSLEIVFRDYSPYLWNAALSGCCSIDRHTQAPLLEELILLYRNNDDSKEFFLFSNYAPRLRRVTLDGIKLTWTPSLFGNLTFLDYTHHGISRGYAAAHEVLDMLRICSYLSELRILFPDKHPTHYHSLPDPLHVPPVVLSKLIDLQFRVEGSDIPFELAHVAILVQTPSLKRLRLVDVDQRNHPLPSVSVFFSMYIIPRSLRILCIECGWYNDRTLSAILRTPSSLQRLVLRRTNMSQQILELAPTRLERHAIRGWGRDK